MAPQFIKTNKNDANDAAVTCEAVTQTTMRFVAIRTKLSPSAIGQQY